MVPVWKCSTFLCCDTVLSRQQNYRQMCENERKCFSSAIVFVCSYKFWHTVPDTNGQRVVLMRLYAVPLSVPASLVNSINATFRHMDACVCILLDVYLYFIEMRRGYPHPYIWQIVCIYLCKWSHHSNDDSRLTSFERHSPHLYWINIWLAYSRVHLTNAFDSPMCSHSIDFGLTPH